MIIENKKKTARIELRASEKEKERIIRNAKRCGISVSEYVLQCCKNNQPRERPPDKFWALMNELYGIYDELPQEKQAQLERLVLSLQEVV